MTADTRKPRNILIVMSVGVVVLLCPIIVMAVVSNFFAVKPPAIAENEDRLGKCITYRTTVVQDEETIANYGALLKQCYNEARYTALLQDFYLRRAKLYNQDIAGSVLLWMVVILTISGVALSAFQLYASYQISVGKETGQEPTGGQEIIISKENISVKTAYVGVAILALSFAFFFIFVLIVYDLKIDRDADKDVVNEPASSVSIPFLPLRLDGPTSSVGIGGLGGAPSVNEQLTPPTP